jgi:hypothetical protein
VRREKAVSRVPTSVTLPIRNLAFSAMRASDFSGASSAAAASHCLDSSDGAEAMGLGAVFMSAPYRKMAAELTFVLALRVVARARC